MLEYTKNPQVQLAQLRAAKAEFDASSRAADIQSADWRPNGGAPGTVSMTEQTGIAPALDES